MTSGSKICSIRSIQKYDYTNGVRLKNYKEHRTVIVSYTDRTHQSNALNLINEKKMPENLYFQQNYEFFHQFSQFSPKNYEIHIFISLKHSRCCHCPIFYKVAVCPQINCRQRVICLESYPSCTQSCGVVQSNVTTSSKFKVTQLKLKLLVKHSEINVRFFLAGCSLQRPIFGWSQYSCFVRNSGSQHEADWLVYLYVRYLD